MSMSIEVKDLKKSYRSFKRREGVVGGIKDLFNRKYREVEAVKGISFNIEPGELVGYIGANGAGKSTSIKMLTGILKPTSGHMSLLGMHPFKERKEYTRHIGVVFGQRTQLWWDIAVIESFRLLQKIYDVSIEDFNVQLDLLVDILDLSEILHTPVRKLSLGQRMRCDLVASLLHKPRLLFLDEPTIGLDAVGKDAIGTFLKRVNRELQTTVLLTTHDLQEIQELCHRIIILDNGEIIYDGDLETIRKLPGLKRKLKVDLFDNSDIKLELGDLQQHVEIEYSVGKSIVASYDVEKVTTVDLIQELMKGNKVADLSVAEPSIEDIVRKIYIDGVNL